MLTLGPTDAELPGHTTNRECFAGLRVDELHLAARERERERATTSESAREERILLLGA